MKNAVVILCGIDKCNRSFIRFRSFINQRKNTFCTGKRHNDRVKLLCDLHERLCKAFCKL